MTLVGFKARNHFQQVQMFGANAKVDERATTAEVFDPLHKRFEFTIDVAALPRNAKCERFYTPEDNGLLQDWSSERVWCNPPYSSIAPWIEKAWLEPDALVVMLLPANRTEQGWWQELVEPFRDRPDSRLRVEFLAGRLRFIAFDKTEVGSNERPPFGCALLIFSAQATAKRSLPESSARV